MAVDNYSSLYKAYLLIADADVDPNITVYSIPGGSDISVDTGRGSPDPDLVYSGTDLASATSTETLP